MNDSVARILRSIIQLAAGGAFTALFLQIAKDVPESYAPYIALISALVVTICQNVAEEEGWVKPFLKPDERA